MIKYQEKAPAKINIFLKVIGKKGSFHEIFSRFVRFPNLFDEIVFEEEKCQQLKIQGNFSCPIEKNTIYSAYNTLKDFVYDPINIIHFFQNHKVVVRNQIQEGAGLGGGPSNAATFLRMTNEICRLGLTSEELVFIGTKVGADVPFFVQNVDSANIKGIGEIVEPFQEKVPALEIFTPDIICSTSNVYSYFREFFYHETERSVLDELESMTSLEILHQLNGRDANDLCLSAISLYPEMDAYVTDEWFMSGSGSTVFSLDKKQLNNVYDN